MKNISFSKLFISITLVSTFLSACTTLPASDPQLSEKLQNEAIEMTFLKNYPAAIEKYIEAIRYNPQNSSLYIQQAEVLEAIQQFTEASKSYQSALDRLPKNHSDLAVIHYRYGLLLARNKNKHRKAKQILTIVTDTSMHNDLKGYISLNGGQPGVALELFNQALKATNDRDQLARIHYHAALAHFENGAKADSSNELFHAVNNAGSLALKQHIRIFFEQMR